MSLLLTLGTQAPKNHFRLLNDKSGIGGGFQTGCRTDDTVHIDRQAATSADDVMVGVSDSRLIACRMTGRLDTSDEASPFQNVQVVIHRLGGECAEPLAGGIRDGFRIPMLSLALDRQEYGETGCGHPQTGPAKGFVKGEFAWCHIAHYRRLIRNQSIVRKSKLWVASGST